MTGISLFWLGASLASFIGVVTDRWFEACWKDIIAGRSRCLVCQKILPLYQILPLVSWIKSRGKCFYCQIPISPVYPLTELGLGACFLILYALNFPFYLYGLAALSLWLSWMDWKYQQLPLLGLGLFMLMGMFMAGSFTLFLFLGMIALFCWQRGWCAEGDVLLLAACGFWLSWDQLPLFLILSGLLILMYNRWQRPTPLAPPLLLALWGLMLTYKIQP